MFSSNSDVRAWVGREEHKMLDHDTLMALHCGWLCMFEMFVNVFLQFRCPCLGWKGRTQNVGPQHFEGVALRGGFTCLKCL